MHILLTNDDGPLDDKTSPYIKYLIDEIIQSTDWELSIVVPSQQRSWIGKAHFAGKTLSSSFIYTKISTDTENKEVNSLEGPFFTPEERFTNNEEYQEWTLVDSTPAACADLGLHHIYKDRKESQIDLVVSGPNFGKNSSNLYILTSGTVGAAMEAVTHNIKAIALSYAFSDLNHDYKILKEAAKISVKLISKLYNLLQKSDDIDLFSVNVPLLESLNHKTSKVRFAPILKNTWESIYQKSDIPNSKGQDQYVWAPDFKYVYKHGLSDLAHSDSRVLLEEGISVTPLKASFNVTEPLIGELSLNSSDDEGDSDDSKHFLVTFPEESYIFKPICDSLVKYFPTCKITDDINILNELVSNPLMKVFHFGEYEDINIEILSTHPEQYSICSYIYRKALIRKHYLANTIRYYVAKHPDSILKTSFPESYQIEVDYAEFLDDALDENVELRYEVENGDKTWILKPSMSEKGQGIRLFKTIEQLQNIFDMFEEDVCSENEDEDEDEAPENSNIITSQLRHFVIQEYIESPLLLSNYDNKKFHLRTYVLCVGNLKVFVYKNLLTLFSDTTYSAPVNECEIIPMKGHLTNTCLQEGKDPMVVPFWELEDSKLDEKKKNTVFNALCNITGDLFEAARTVDSINFQPMSNSLEVYGLDFLVNSDYSVSLLEVNAYPDFKQTGTALKDIIYKLFDDVVSIGVRLLMCHKTDMATSDTMQLVYNWDDKRS